MRGSLSPRMQEMSRRRWNQRKAQVAEIHLLNTSCRGLHWYIFSLGPGRRPSNVSRNGPSLSGQWRKHRPSGSEPLSECQAQA